MSGNYFQVLNLPETAKHSEVEKAYKKTFAIYEKPGIEGHPVSWDREPKHEAYRFLSNPSLCRRYADFVASGKQGAFHVEPNSASNGILAALGTVDGHSVNAIPDTGAGCNLLSSLLAERLGLEPPSSPLEQDTGLRMANGNTIMSAGVVNATWAFAYDPERSWNITFQVIINFAHDLVLGSDFLRASGTMDQHRARLSKIPRPPWATSVLFTSNIGPVCQRLRGTIDGVPVRALADSGSESNLVSLRFARRLTERPNTIDWTDQRLLRFPDRKIEKTMGSFWAHWAYRDETGAPSTCDDAAILVHILESCTHDVILGQHALEQIQAFTGHIDSFVESDQTSEPVGFNLVIWIPAKRPKMDQATDAGATDRQNQQTLIEHSEIPPQSQTSESLSGPEVSNISELQGKEAEDSWWSRRVAERKRQFAARRHILSMSPGPDRDAATAKEQEMRRVFKAREKSILPKQATQQPRTYVHHLEEEMEGEALNNHDKRRLRFFSPLTRRWMRS